MSLVIVSYNLHRSHAVLEDLLAKPSLRSVHAILLQEPPSSLPAMPGWHILLPPPALDPEGGTHRARAITLVSNTIGPTAIEQLHVPSPDTVAITLHLADGQRAFAVNVYNPASGSAAHLRSHNESVRQLPAVLAKAPPGARLVVAGDFNLHHQEWEPDLVSEPTDEALEAVRTFADANLVHVLPPGTATFLSPTRTLHCNDLVLTDLQSEGQVISCQVDMTLDAGSDHYPLRLVLDLTPQATTTVARRAFRRARADNLLAAYQSASATHPAPTALRTETEVAQEAERLTNVLTATVEAAVPLVKARNPRYAHRWWNDELDAACREARRLRNQARTAVARGWAGAEEKLLRAKVASNRKKALLRRSKREFETAEAKAITEANLWRKVKEASGSASVQAATPPLRAGLSESGDQTYASSPSAKLEMLRPLLLPPSNPAQRRRGGDRQDNCVASRPLSPTAAPFVPHATHLRHEAGSLTADGHAFPRGGIGNDMQSDPAHKCEPRAARSRAAQPACLGDEQVSHHFNVTRLARRDGVESRQGEATDVPAVLDWPALDEGEVQAALFNARPFSAPGSDGVPFKILQDLWPALRERLMPLYAASLRLGHLPRT